MPYTLAKGFVWIALALLLGVIIGWLLRSIVAKRQVARARAHHVDSAEMERLRGRVANLEPVVAERDRLRDELDGLRSISAGDSVPDETASVATFASVDAPGPSASTSSGPTASPVAAAPAAPAVPSAPSAPDVDEGSAILGRIIELDDLKVVEGIGPKIRRALQRDRHPHMVRSVDDRGLAAAHDAGRCGLAVPVARPGDLASAGVAARAMGAGPSSGPGPTNSEAAELSTDRIQFVLDGDMVDVDPSGSLLDALREQLGVRSVKDGCSPQGQCGCCTVWVDGQPRVSWSHRSRGYVGALVTTVDGIADQTAWAAFVRRSRREPVRILHARHHHACRSARRDPPTIARRRSAGDAGPSLPVHRMVAGDRVDRRRR